MERLLFISLFLIIVVLVMICYVLIDLHNNLKNINNTIIDIHPNYKYKKVYESKKYKTKIF